MAEIEKLVTNGVQVVSQTIQKSGDVTQSAIKPIEAASEKLTNALSGLAASNSVLVSQKSKTGCIESLHELYEKAKKIFVEEHRKNIPSFEERFREILPDMCGTTEWDMNSRADGIAYNVERYLKHIWEKSPQARDLMLNMKLAEFSDEQLAVYNKAIQVLDSLKVKYDKYHLVCMPEKDLKKIAQGEASCGGCTVYGHLRDYAYNINPRLRMGNTDSWQRVVLDAGFQSLTPTDRPCIVYRLVTGSEEDKISFEYMKKLLGLKEGETFIDKGYSHTSYVEKGIAVCGASQSEGIPEVKQTILVPAGAKVSNGSDLRQIEMLFPRNSEFRVVEPAHEVSKGFAEMLLEYVLPQSH